MQHFSVAFISGAVEVAVSGCSGLFLHGVPFPMFTIRLRVPAPIKGWRAAEPYTPRTRNAHKC